MSVDLLASYSTGASAGLQTAHLSTVTRTCPLTITTFAFCTRSEAPAVQASACSFSLRLTVTTPVSSPQTASQRGFGPSIELQETHLSMRFKPLLSGCTSFTLPNFGFFGFRRSSSFMILLIEVLCFLSI